MGKNSSEKNCIGTLEFFVKLYEYLDNAMVPVYIEVDDGIRFSHAIERERNEVNPKYKELCRRFIAGCDDFSEENLLSLELQSVFKITVILIHVFMK